MHTSTHGVFASALDGSQMYITNVERKVICSHHCGPYLNKRTEKFTKFAACLRYPTEPLNLHFKIPLFVWKAKLLSFSLGAPKFVHLSWSPFYTVYSPCRREIEALALHGIIFARPFPYFGLPWKRRAYLVSGAAGTVVSVMEQEIIFSHALCPTFPYCDPVAMATENTARQLTAIKRSLPYPRH